MHECFIYPTLDTPLGIYSLTAFRAVLPRHGVPKIQKFVQFLDFRNLLVYHCDCHWQGSFSLQCVPHIFRKHHWPRWLLHL